MGCGLCDGQVRRPAGGKPAFPHTCARVRSARLRRSVADPALSPERSASEWQEVLQTAVKTALVLVVLDLLRITKDRPWFEEHADFVSVQAMLFNGAARNWWAQTRVLVRYQARLTDE